MINSTADCTVVKACQCIVLVRGRVTRTSFQLDRPDRQDQASFGLSPSCRARLVEPVFSSPSILSPILWHSVNELLQGGIDGVFARFADPLVPDHALMIDNKERWCRIGIPLTVDGAIVVKSSPSDVKFLHGVFQFTRIMRPGVDADESERFIFEFRYERPLVRPSGPSRQSELRPEIEQHDLAAKFAQFK